VSDTETRQTGGFSASDGEALDFDQPCVGLAVRPTWGGGTSSVRRQLLHLLPESPALVLADERRVLAVLSVDASLGQAPRRRRFFRTLHHRLRAAGRTALAWSCVHTGSTGWRHALDEADQALSAVIRVLGPDHAAGYAEALVLSLVLGQRDPDRLRALHQHLLAPLWVHDQQEHMDLISTLETYLETACNASHTAELLRVHRNSVANRLQRIREVCDVDLEDPDMRLLMQLLLRSTRGLTQESLSWPGVKQVGAMAGAAPG
jgi:DNA-binding PucR family transcriptional regulator